MMRLFIAIDLPQPIGKQISIVLKDLSVGRPVPVEQIHLTLSFLGEIPESLFSELKTVLKKLTFQALTLQLKGVGCFPSKKRPKVLWIGVQASTALNQLKGEIDGLLMGVGLETEKRDFRPHLTIARFKKPHPAEVLEFLTRNMAFQSDPFEVKQFHLYSSELTPNGAIHTKELSIGLK